MSVSTSLRKRAKHALGKIRSYGSGEDSDHESVGSSVGEFRTVSQSNLRSGSSFLHLSERPASAHDESPSLRDASPTSPQAGLLVSSQAAGSQQLFATLAQHIRNGDLAALRAELKSGADLRDATNPLTGETLLMHATSASQPDIVTFLVREVGIDINARDKHGWTVLHYLAGKPRFDQEDSFQYLNVLLFLLQKQHDLANVQNSRGETPAHQACKYGGKQSLMLLIKFANIDFRVKTNRGEDLLLYAVRCPKASLPLVLFLLETSDHWDIAAVQDFIATSKEPVAQDIVDLFASNPTAASPKSRRTSCFLGKSRLGTTSATAWTTATTASSSTTSAHDSAVEQLLRSHVAESDSIVLKMACVLDRDDSASEGGLLYVSSSALGFLPCDGAFSQPSSPIAVPLEAVRAIENHTTIAQERIAVFYEADRLGAALGQGRILVFTGLIHFADSYAQLVDVWKKWLERSPAAAAPTRTSADLSGQPVADSSHGDDQLAPLASSQSASNIAERIQIGRRGTAILRARPLFASTSSLPSSDSVLSSFNQSLSQSTNQSTSQLSLDQSSQSIVDQTINQSTTHQSTADQSTDQSTTHQSTTNQPISQSTVDQSTNQLIVDQQSSQLNPTLSTASSRRPTPPAKSLPTLPFSKLEQKFAKQMDEWSRTYLPKMVFDSYGFAVPFGRTMQFLEFGADVEHESERQWEASGFFSSQMSLDLALATRDADFYALVDRHGFPAGQRRRMWSLLAKVAKKKEAAVPRYWQELSHKTARQLKTPHQIEIDISRTFNNHPLFTAGLLPGVSSQPGLALLRHVLVAYSERNASVGYCQSMNYLAGFLLVALRGDVETSFWILCAIVEELLFDYYTHRMQGIAVDQAAFSDVLPRLFPELHEHWRRIGLPWHELQHSTTFRWFLTMYSSGCEIFPSSLLVYIWDQFFLRGAVVLFEVGLALFKLCEKELLASDSYLDLPGILRQQANGMFSRERFAAALVQTRAALADAGIDLNQVRQGVIFRSCTAATLKINYTSFPLKVPTTSVPAGLLRDIVRKYSSSSSSSLSLSSSPSSSLSSSAASLPSSASLLSAGAMLLEQTSLLHILVCLQQASVGSAAELLEEAKIPADAIRALFTYIDVDGDGRVTFEELAIGLLLRVFYSATFDDHLRFAYQMLSPIDARGFAGLLKTAYCVAFQNQHYMAEHAAQQHFLSPAPLSFKQFMAKLRTQPRLLIAFYGEHNTGEQNRQAQWQAESAGLFK